MKCLFCSIAKNPANHSQPEDEVIAQTNNLYAKPALGHFIEGYTLIVSKRHYLSFAHSDPGILNELELFKSSLSERLSSIYSLPIVAFEHGEVDLKHPAGCCIEHAHLHLVPLSVDVHSMLMNQFPHERILSMKQLSKYAQDSMSYLFYQGTDRTMLVFKIDQGLPCQYLRRLICKAIGQPEVWDWAAYPFTDKISLFKSAYQLNTKEVA